MATNFLVILHGNFEFVMERLFLLDAYALIYRSYYAFIKNPRINSKGQNTSAIMGFLNPLQEVLTKEQPTHIGSNTGRHPAVCSYHQRNTPRL